MSDSMPVSAPTTKPVSARVTPEYVALIDDLRPLYVGPDGTAAKRSDVLRAFFEVALPAVGDLALHRRLQALAHRLRRPIGEVCRDALRAGLDAIGGDR